MVNEPESSGRTSTVNHLLNQWRQGNTTAFRQVTILLHEDLKRIAHRQFGKERRNHTMETDDLVNQLYIKLLQSPPHNWTERSHFLNAAARCMRQILIDHARKWNHRADGKYRVGWNAQQHQGCTSRDFLEQVINIDELLTKVEEINRVSAQIANLRLVLGMTLAEIADELNMDLNKVKREWLFIKKYMSESLKKQGRIPNYPQRMQTT